MVVMERGTDLSNPGIEASKHEFSPTDGNEEIENMLKLGMSSINTESSGGYESLASIR